MPAIPPTTDFPKATITKDTFHSKLLEIHAYLTGLLGADGVAATARGQLGLGTAATKSAGITAGTIPLWDHIPLNSVSAKTAGYTVVAADRGKLIDFSGLSANAEAALPAVSGNAGLVFGFRNSDPTYTLTLNPNSVEDIDGVNSIDLAAGESCLVVCDGTEWKTVGRATTPTYKAKVSANDTTAGYLNGKLVAGANITLTEGSDGGNETLTIAATGVSADVGSIGIGSIHFAMQSSGGTVAAGGTVAGSSVFGISIDGATTTSTINSGTALSGTWKNISGFSVATFASGSGTVAGMFQRIA